MSLGINYILFDYWEENWDPRSRSFWLVNGGPIKIIMIVLFYLFFCLRLGPYLMQNRKPLQLRKAMMFYNITTVLLNFYFFCATFYHLNYGLELFNFKFPSRTEVTDLDMIKARLVNFYIWTKLYDLADTVFFVLRKKQNQITGLHLYHHAVVPLLCWVALKLAPTAPCLGVFPLFNTLVHVIMYSYYALAALGPKVQRYLWWKKYITQLQMAQFVIYGLYLLVFVPRQEGYPIKFWSFIGMPQPFIFLYLFYSFYRRSYHSTTTTSPATSNKTTTTSSIQTNHQMNCLDKNNCNSNNNNNDNDVIDLNHKQKSEPDPHCHQQLKQCNGLTENNDNNVFEHLKAN